MPVRAGTDPVGYSICPQQIALNLNARGKSEVLDQVAKALKGTGGLEAEPILRALQRREQAGSTAVGNGLAIPHARIPGIDAPVTMFARTTSPIRFGGPDGKPVSEFFVILVPSEGAIEAHLQRLRMVAELFSDSAFRTTLAAATSPSAIADAFARWTVPPAANEPEPLLGLS